MKWNLRSKLSASLTAAFGLLAVEASISQWAIWHVRGDIERLSQQTPITRAARDLVENVATEANSVASYVELHDRSILIDRTQSIARQQLALSTLNQAAQHTAYLTPLIAELEARRSAMRRDFAAEISAADDQHPALASWLVLRTQDRLATLRTAADTIGDAVTSDLLAASNEYQTTARQAAFLTILTVVGSTLLFSIIAFSFGRSVSRRLGHVSNRLGALADELAINDSELVEGEHLSSLRWTPIDESGNDEISQLARGSNHLVRRLIAAGNSLFEQQQRLRATLSSITDAVLRTQPNGIVDYVNPAALRLLGYSAQEVDKRHLRELFSLEVDGEILADPVAHCMESHGTIFLHNHARLRLPGGRVIEVTCSISPLYSHEGALRGSVIALRDATEERALSQQLEHQATHDALTGLFNRRRLEADLEKALVSARNEARIHALLYVYLDQFKVINDTCGHAAGDEMLCQLSSLFGSHVGAFDTLARIGGDEFAILLFDRTLQQAEKFANELRETVTKSAFTWNEQRFPMTISVGLVPVAADAVSGPAILSTVDAACYAAKDGGRNRVRVFAERETDTEMTRTFGEMKWVSRINRAVAENRFRIFYQPIRSLKKDGDFRHVELLLRMVDEESRLITPLEFLPAAERYNLMGTIDRWVVTHALPICARLIEAGSLDLCSINLSDASLRNEGLSRFLQTQIAYSGIDPRAVCFEITETVAVTNAGRISTLIQELHGLGCRFALDDFGSGMSSFGLLKRLPVDYLKIDGSFVKGIAEDAIDYAMVESINRVGHVMGIKTVAEYVSKMHIADKLREIGVDYGQGYALGRPEPLTDLLASSRVDERRLRVVSELRAG